MEGVPLLIKLRVCNIPGICMRKCNEFAGTVIANDIAKDYMYIILNSRNCGIMNYEQSCVEKHTIGITQF